jgi:hypothetical protein
MFASIPRSGATLRSLTAIESHGQPPTIAPARENVAEPVTV